MVSRTAAMTPRTREKLELENFPADVRNSYSVLLPKFNALRVVIDEQTRNTRDILEQREQTGTGSRPKTAAGIQLLLKSILKEYESLQERHEVWVQSKRANKKQDITQVGAILADLERKLNDVLQKISEIRKMWESFRRKGSAQVQRRIKSSKRKDLHSAGTSRSSSSRGSRVSSEEFQLPSIKGSSRISQKEEGSDTKSVSDVKSVDDVKSVSDLKIAMRDAIPSMSSQGVAALESRMLKRRERTYLQPTRQRSNRTRQKLIELQTKGMTPQQLRNYFRERSFLNSVARRGSLHADADKRLLERRDSGGMGLGMGLQSKQDHSEDNLDEPMKAYRVHYNSQQANVPTWTREGTMGLRRETTLHFIRNIKPKPILKTRNDSFPSGQPFRRLSPVASKEKDRFKSLPEEQSK